LYTVFGRIRSTLRYVILCYATGMFAVCSFSLAQTADFSERRSKFVADLAAATTPILKQASSALQTLEKNAAQARDYDAAISAREERKQVEALIADQEKMQLLTSAQQQTQLTQQPVKLSLAEAKLSGVVLENGALTHWEDSDSTATWILPKLAPGGYEVVLQYKSDASEGGTLLIQESFYSLKATLETTLKGATKLNAGTLRIKDGSGSLTLRPLSVVGQNLMRLEAVELLPAAR
jgi:hypothetical protein